MQDTRWDRWGAIAGILFVAVAVVAAALTGSPPQPNDTDQMFKNFFIDKQDQLVTQAWLYALSAPLLLWFGATVRHELRRAERDESYLADLFLAGTTVDAALLVAAMAMQIAIANVLPRWTAWLAAVAVILNVAGTIGVFSDTGPFSLEGGLTVFVPFLSTMLWYLGTSIALLRAQVARLV